jgi:hypothetical protein
VSYGVKHQSYAIYCLLEFVDLLKRYGQKQVHVFAVRAVLTDDTLKFLRGSQMLLLIWLSGIADSLGTQSLGSSDSPATLGQCSHSHEAI